MSQQVGLFEALRERDEAMERVYENAGPIFQTAAMRLAYICALSFPEFTSHAILSRLPDEAQPHNGCAMGWIMRKAAQRGWIEKTTRHRSEGQRRNHVRPQQVWRSRIYRGSTAPMLEELRR